MRPERERTVINETVNKRGTKEKLQNKGKNGNKYEGDTEKRERLIRESDQVWPCPASFWTLLLRVSIWWLLLLAAVLGAVNSSVSWLACARGRPGPLLVVLSRGSDG